MKNKYGIKIKKCCGSCLLRQIKNEEGRICKLSGESVKGSFLCENWVMHHRLENAGMGGGNVKSLKYLNYYRERWLKQQEDLVAKRITADAFVSAADIRKEFNELYGSEFINI